MDYRLHCFFAPWIIVLNQMVIRNDNIAIAYINTKTEAVSIRQIEICAALYLVSYKAQIIIQTFFNKIGLHTIPSVLAGIGNRIRNTVCIGIESLAYDGNHNKFRRANGACPRCHGRYLCDCNFILYWFFISISSFSKVLFGLGFEPYCKAPARRRLYRNHSGRFSGPFSVLSWS